MKPRIYLFCGVWHCRSGGRDGRIGIGFTPMDAYEDWRKAA